MQPDPVFLTSAGSAVASYHGGSGIDPTLSPRPYLHPVRTPGGIALTEIYPADHRHHYGVSAAIADINGTTYWGGRSYVDGEGYTMLPNQGRQLAADAELTESEGRTVLRQQVTWIDADGAQQLTEDREIRVATSSAAPNAVHLLTWRSDLHASGPDLMIGSPATRGRTGAGYGGLFWRLGPSAQTDVRVRTPAGMVTGEDESLGAVGPWLTLSQDRQSTVTLLLGQPEDDLLPWFVRTSGYVGAGPAVAWAEHLHVPAGTTHSLHLWAALADTDLDPETADDLHAELEDLSR